MRGALLAALLWAPVASAAPTLQDFARGLLLDPEPDRPAQELALPDAVYEGVTRSDLADLRVFNAAGIVVPHALCAGPAPANATARDEPLPVFELRLASGSAGSSARIDVQTATGTRVQVDEAPASAPGPATAAYVIDAHAVTLPLRALRLAWHARDGASEVPVRVQASDDLESWRTVVASATLLRSAAGDLERVRVALPTERYAYLRLERSDGGPPPVVEQAIAEALEPPAAPAPTWFVPAPTEAAPPADFTFDTQRLAPAQFARVGLPQPNMTLRVALDSRAQPKLEWQPRWSGAVRRIEAPPAVVAFAATADRLWRLRVVQGAETLGGGRPILELGYHPARLRFLVQGAAPFTLAFGSARIGAAERPDCDELLGPETPGVALLGSAASRPAPAGRFGGNEALRPRPPPAPVRQIVLWLVLGLAVLVLLLMALSLLKRLRPG